MMLLPILLLWLRSPMAFPRRTRWMLLAVLSLGFVGVQPPAGSVAQAPTAANRLSDATASRSPETIKSREGTQLESVPGRVIEIGRRWALVTDDEKRTYRILENLALERIARALRAEPSDDHWSVSGTLTEFSGQNYLLLGVVTRASSDQTSKPAAGQDAGAN